MDQAGWRKENCPTKSYYSPLNKVTLSMGGGDSREGYRPDRVPDGDCSPAYLLSGANIASDFRHLGITVLFGNQYMFFFLFVLNGVGGVG